MKPEIRIATVADAAAACDVLCRSIAECCVEDHRNDADMLATWLANKTPETVACWFTSPNNHAVVAIRDGAVVGVGLLTRAGKIALCHVTPEARFTGIGRALLQALEAQAVCWGIPELKLASTATAKAFYLRNGFTPGRDTTVAFGIPATAFSKRLDGRPAAARKPCCYCAKDEVA